MARVDNVNWGNKKVAATGGFVSRSFADRFADNISVKEFGTLGTNDDSSVFSAAWAALKAKLNVTQGLVPYRLVIPPGIYRIATPINWTGGVSTYLGWNTHILAEGAVFLGNTTGKAVVDMTGVRGVHTRGLAIYGDPTNTPTAGVMIGNIGTGTCGNNRFTQVKTTGSFTKAPAVNFGSETSQWEFCYFINNIATNTAYAFIGDGKNRFSLTSDYATLRSADTAVSFTNNRFMGCRFQKDTGGNAVYIEGSIGWQFDPDCYFLAFDDSTVLIRQTAATRNSSLRIGGLFETVFGAGLKYVVTVVQPDTESSAIAGFELLAATPHAATAIIRLARESDMGNMTSGLMSFRQARLVLQGKFSPTSPVLFAGPKMDWRGDIIAGDATQVNLGILNEFHGTLQTNDYGTIVSAPGGNSSGIAVDATHNMRMIGLQSFADDAAAATGGVPVGGLYRSGSSVNVRAS